MSLHDCTGIGMSSSETLLMLDQEGFIGWKHKIVLKCKCLHNQWSQRSQIQTPKQPSTSRSILWSLLQVAQLPLLSRQDRLQQMLPTLLSSVLRG